MKSKYVVIYNTSARLDESLKTPEKLIHGY